MTTQNMLRGRQVIASLTNQSGGAIIAGDVVIVSAANDESFTTTTSAAYNSTRVGVALESIAAAAAGRVLLEGYAPLVNVSASATRGHYLLTHTVAKQATSQAGYAAGAFGQILKAGTTPSAMIFPVAQVGSAGVTRSGSTTDGNLAVWNGANADSIKDGGAPGGAPTTAKYVTTAANAGLSAEVAIPGLAGSADILGAGGAGTAEEFDGADPFTYSSALTATDTNTTVLSHWYGADSAGSAKYVYKAWAPAGAFDARWKIAVGSDDHASWAVACWIGDNANNNGVFVSFELTGNNPNTMGVIAYTDAAGSYVKRGNTWPVGGTDVYIRITRDASDNVSFYWSTNGMVWSLIATQNFAVTVARIGFRVNSVTAGKFIYVACDWLRTSV